MATLPGAGRVKSFPPSLPSPRRRGVARARRGISAPNRKGATGTANRTSPRHLQWRPSPAQGGSRDSLRRSLSASERGGPKGRGEVIFVSMTSHSDPQTSSGVVALQYVDDNKKRQARELRKNMTAAESVLWEHLRRKSLHGFKFRRQQVIEGFVADFFCEKAKLVVEVDGGVHETEMQKKIDEHRRAVLRHED